MKGFFATAYAVASVYYFLEPSIWSKPLPIAILSISCLVDRSSTNQKYSSWISFGLLSSLIGDILLWCSDHGTFPSLSSDNSFKLGLVAFFLAHVFYISAFYKNVLQVWCDSAVMKLVSVVVVSYYAMMMNAILPVVDTELQVPVAGYGVVISAMIYHAIQRLYNAPTDGSISLKSRQLAFIGSLVFVISDSVLAINKFTIAVENGQTIIMITYFIGQFFIAASSPQNVVSAEPNGKNT
jgi:alkenylglycerophosphocholine/alkenylglycerophosphoethanolamine hydrolase